MQFCYTVVYICTVHTDPVSIRFCTSVHYTQLLLTCLELVLYICTLYTQMLLTYLELVLYTCTLHTAAADLLDSPREVITIFPLYNGQPSDLMGLPHVNGHPGMLSPLC